LKEKAISTQKSHDGAKLRPADLQQCGCRHVPEERPAAEKPSEEIHFFLCESGDKYYNFLIFINEISLLSELDLVTL